MTNAEIKEWLEWFSSVTDKASSHKNENGLYYFYTGFCGGAIACHPIYGDFYVNSELQLVLQDEIQRQGWTFKLDTYYSENATLQITRGRKTLSRQDGETILEAFMLAFREAWEATDA